MQTQPDLIRIINEVATRYGHDANWLRAIVAQESSYRIYAMRFESAYQYLYKQESFAKRNNISLSTEVTCQKISWGLCQIMGGLAREQGLSGLLGELFDPEINLNHLGIRIRDLKKYSLKVEDIFAMYNGGPGALKKIRGKYINDSYVKSAMNYLANYQTSN